MKLVTIFVLVFGTILVSCKAHDQNSVAASYTSNDEIKPYTQPYENAFLLFGSAALETRLETKVSPGGVNYNFMKGDTLIDSERYQYSDKEFLYAGNENEVFRPGIPLLKFPFNVGQSWDWNGIYVWGGMERTAEATVRTKEEKLKTVLGDFETIHVSVELTISAKMKTPSVQTFDFWIAPNRGIVQRDFQNSGSREPMPLVPATSGQ